MGKWDEFNKSINDKVEAILSEITKSYEEMLESIKDCMVDLEDYEIFYKNNVGNHHIICYYEYSIPIGNIDILIDISKKLDDVIGPNAWYILDGNYKEIKLERIMQSTNEYVKFFISFKALDNFSININNASQLKLKRVKSIIC